ncbi:MAG TPA: FtsX-like permease family protein, partial [Vicinamibacterales bacterium]|nr:FtsX-like permease family protein [Vicinamibacterales bacterium]
GVAVAVSVLAGSLLVGDSVRASLRRIALERLGRTDAAILGETFFREQLASDIADRASDGRVTGAVPMIAVEGIVSHATGGRRAGAVQVFGVDDRFWRFHGVEDVSGPGRRDVYLSPELAREIEAGEGDPVLLRVRHVSDIPASALQGRRDDLGRSFRAIARRVLDTDRLGEFSLTLGQSAVRSVFVPLERLQQELAKEGQANIVLLSLRDDGSAATVDDIVGRAVRLEDLGLASRSVEGQHALSVESRSGFINPAWQDAIDRAAQAEGLRAHPVLTYIANTIRIDSREIPYSVVSGLDFGLSGEPPTASDGRPAIWLNEWTARELQARTGDPVALEYFRWSDEEGLETEEASFVMAGVIPMSGIGGDRTLTPEYPGMTDAPRIGEWDPPFPVDLGRIQPRDERYWDEYRTAPKAFVAYEDARRLWASRFGEATSMRLFVPRERRLEDARESIEAALTAGGAARSGLSAQPVRDRALAAARGATDFGEYFLYFSFFLFVSGLILAVLFFRLGIEQRSAQIGLLQALGFTARDIRGLFLAEGSVLAGAGTLLGVPGAVAFCAAILAALRTWWIDAVGTAQITLDVRASSLAAGALAGLAAAIVTTVLSLRALRGTTARSLIAGTPLSSAAVRRQRFAGLPLHVWAGSAALLAAVMIALAAMEVLPSTAGFFGAGALLLIASVLFFLWTLRRPVRSSIQRPGLVAVMRLGARQTRWRPGRSALVATLVAAATFVIVAVGAFRRDASIDARAPRAGTGGFPLFAESVIPVMHDPGSAEGREELGFGTEDEALLEGVSIARLRLRPGDEGSCLNLYRPGSPRILGVPASLRREERFEFAAVLEGSSAEEQADPWRLLDRVFEDGAVPVIGDATSLTYVLHVGVGEDIVVSGDDGRPIVLRVVAALSHSMLQSELMISEEQFVRLFPRRDGYRFFLVDAPPERQAEVVALLEDRLADAGLDVQSSVDRIRGYERVERTYLTTFQTLGGLGLVMGTLGLGAVLLRNVLERRRELALLRAIGYRHDHVRGLVLAESLLLLGAGVAAGVLSAGLAVAPALRSRGGGAAWVDTALLLTFVALAGIGSSLMAARAATTAAPISALRSE